MKFKNIISAILNLGGDSSIGIIGGADGPTAVVVSGDSAFFLFAACAIALIAAAIILIFVLKRINKNK